MKYLTRKHIKPTALPNLVRLSLIKNISQPFEPLKPMTAYAKA